VLPYLPEPYGILEQIIAHSPDFIILDRTMVISSGQDRLTVQNNSSMIGKSSYPAWFFSEANLLAAFEPEYQLISSFTALGDKVLLRFPFGLANFKGYIFKHK
jgi:putative methyltransferase (TIGR04325 family)